MIVGAGRAAEAAAVFDYQSTCTMNCASIGLVAGEPVSAWISFADAAIAPGAFVTQADVLDFAIDFGTVEITAATAVGFVFNGALNAAGNAFEAPFFFLAGEAMDPDVGDLAAFSAGEFSAGPGFCTTPTCVSALYAGPFWDHSNEGGTLVLREVPEPGALAMLGAGLAGLVLARRRKQGASANDSTCSNPRPGRIHDDHA